MRGAGGTRGTGHHPNTPSLPGMGMSHPCRAWVQEQCPGCLLPPPALAQLQRAAVTLTHQENALRARR